MNDAQQDAINARMAWGEKRRTLFKEFAEKLSVLAVEDFEHQVGPRGVEQYKSYLEANEATKSFCDDLANCVKGAVQKKLSDRMHNR